MKVTVFGSGYVGLVTAACLAEVGHNVCCMDVDAFRVGRLNKGEVPIFEPGLQEIVQTNLEEQRLWFTSDSSAAVAHGQIQFIAVGTPSGPDGSADLRFVDAVAAQIGDQLKRRALVVVKSTVPVGTGDRVRQQISMALQLRDVALDFSVASNPEFLKEGAAVNDFMKPDRIIVGRSEQLDEKGLVEDMMRELYAPFNRNHDRLMFMDVRSAELTKYAANAMLATKISFINEVANIAEHLGADVEAVRNGIGADPRIGYHFIYPGCGYGGSCFPKDVSALEHLARAHDYQPLLLQAVDAVNHRQRLCLFDKLEAFYHGDLAGKRIAVWGLAFKPNTDDMREAPSRYLMESLWQAGALVQAFDPQAQRECRRLYGDHPALTLCGSKEAALEGADALVICTEWKNFWAPDFELIAESLQDRLVVDGRNIFAPEIVARYGLRYLSIGRPETALAKTRPDLSVVGQ
ncbi:MAG: UDP-glucose 6-dehydrogenase [Candidatus Pelagadaptatus aseana]|uniref:UDP-glucose dehydrogenase family protein n=1 Tax=Candidatus Pelagadaptatus aseana TaxID=3120508 RepID=UPI0039B27093